MASVGLCDFPSLRNHLQRDPDYVDAHVFTAKLTRYLSRLLALSCFGQVNNSLHPSVAFPGDWLQFRGDRKLTGRSNLVGNISQPATNSSDLATAGEPRFIQGMVVSGGFFAALGLQPELRRLFS